ncbi:hypothetical protein CRUP_026559 [Coryphaenoides rupestris]|nr:hypothetical protein CRUP_026559 [Coryphaenoides rupestris]
MTEVAEVVTVLEVVVEVLDVVVTTVVVVAAVLLHSEHFPRFFRYVEMSTFDIASDAFATFKDLLTRHKVLVAEYLDQNYDAVFTDYEKLLHSENYVTKRQSLKLLGELLLDRHNFTVFVANPNKSQPIVDILVKNQTKLIDFLSNFQKERTDDEQFNDEKTYLIKQIRDLKKPAS